MASWSARDHVTTHHVAPHAQGARPRAHQASGLSTSLGGCTVHAYEPHYVTGTALQGHGAIDCGLTNRQTVQIEVCLQVWGSGQWWTKNETCLVSGYGNDYIASINAYSNVAWNAACGHSYRTLVWADVNGAAVWYAYDAGPGWVDCYSPGT
jgi:hypothetical protein